MSKIRLDDTIVAISTPVGEGGIGIVRLSGRDALKIADRIFVSRNDKRPSRVKTYTVHYGHIFEKVHKRAPRFRSGQASTQEHKIVDEVLLTVMRAPKSYTKEDVVEINCHSGIVPLRKILGIVLENGGRLAEPGEFTKRAFLNGRINITQAEAVLDIIRAKTDLSLRAAINSLKGAFSKKIEDVRDRLLSIFSNIEASIDFSYEEDIDHIKKKDVLKGLKGIKKDMEKIISTASDGKVLRQGIKTVICGSPNVGKSSLMNALIKESRAIVTDIPGTTRDTIEEIVNIKGIPLVLVDTAGIIDTRHPADKEGVKRSRSSIEAADLILLVLDYSRRINKNDKAIMSNLKNKENIIIVVNKKDLKKRIDIKVIRKTFPKNRVVYISAIDLSGIEGLEHVICDIIFKGKAPSADLVSVSNERQLSILRHSLGDINAAIDSFNGKIPMDCIGVYVRSSIENLGAITGHSITEEVLDRIFSEFCIGK